MSVFSSKLTYLWCEDVKSAQKTITNGKQLPSPCELADRTRQTPHHNVGWTGWILKLLGHQLLNIPTCCYVDFAGYSPDFVDYSPSGVIKHGWKIPDFVRWFSHVQFASYRGFSHVQFHLDSWPCSHINTLVGNILCTSNWHWIPTIRSI